MFSMQSVFLKSFTDDSHISVVVCGFFEFGAVSKCCRREWVNRWTGHRETTETKLINDTIATLINLKRLVHRLQTASQKHFADCVTTSKIRLRSTCSLILDLHRPIERYFFFPICSRPPPPTPPPQNALTHSHTRNFGLFHTERVCR